MKPLREYPSPKSRDWKTAEQIQAEINLMHAMYQKRQRKTNWRDHLPGDLTVGITLGIIGLVVCVILSHLY